jgi:hypothetical protein
MAYNPVLMECAEYALGTTKVAFVPAGMPPPGQQQPGMSPGGAPPMDPSMGGGMPPPGQDPNAGAPPAPPPQDPNAGAAPPPPPPPEQPPAAPAPAQPAQLDPETIRAIIREEMAMGGKGGAGGKGKAPKADLNQIYAMQAKTQKMLAHLLGSTGVGLPPNILDDEQAPAPDQGQGQAQPAAAPKAAEYPFNPGTFKSSREVFNAADALAAILRAQR